MTGIRSWTAEVTPFGVVVRIEHVSRILPPGSFQVSHSPSESEQLTFVDLKAVRLLKFFGLLALIKPSAGMRHLRSFNASRNAGFAAAGSDLALIIPAALDESLAHQGIRLRRPTGGTEG